MTVQKAAEELVEIEVEEDEEDPFEGMKTLKLLAFTTE